MEVVQRAWDCPLRDTNPFRWLDWLLRNTPRMLKSWSDRLISNICVQLEMAKEVVSRLEVARDSCPLVVHEEALRCEMKLKSLGLSSLQCSIARQESRVLWLSEGDTPTKFFHAQASSQRRHKFIRTLEHEGQILVDEDHYATAFFYFYNSIMGVPSERACSIALKHMHLPHLELQHLCDHFIESKVWDVIKALPLNKVPEPDKFSARFLQSAWQIIRPDLMVAFDAFWRHDSHNMHDVNGALMVLLPKTSKVITLKHYKPISLIHSVGKIISKLLANRLAPRLSELIHPSQSAFIK
jgi:hypothetical protein